MKTDRTIKVLLALLVLGVWLNAITAPSEASQTSTDLADVVRELKATRDTMIGLDLSQRAQIAGIEQTLSKIAFGVCVNKKICTP